MHGSDIGFAAAPVNECSYRCCLCGKSTSLSHLVDFEGLICCQVCLEDILADGPDADAPRWGQCLKCGEYAWITPTEQGSLCDPCRVGTPPCVPVDPAPSISVAVVPTRITDQFGDQWPSVRYVDIAPHRLWYWAAQPAVQIVDQECVMWHGLDDDPEPTKPFWNGEAWDTVPF